MGIHKIIVQFNHYDCRQLAIESPHDANILRYITSDLIYMVLKSKGKDKVKSSMARSLPVENLLPQNVGSIINYLQ